MDGEKRMKMFILDKSGKTKLAIVISLVLMLISVLVFSSAFSLNENYFVGDEVKFDFQNEGIYSVKIITPSKVFLKEGENDVFIFTLNEVGEYSFEVNSDSISKTYVVEVFEKDLEIRNSENSSELNFNEKLTEEVSLEEEAIIKVGEPVPQKKEVNLDYPSDIEVKIPDYGENVFVLENGVEKEFKEKEDALRGIKRILSLEVEKEILIEDAVGEIEIQYESPAPEKTERAIDFDSKEIVVSSIDDVHYENVLAFTEIEEKYTLDEKDFIEIFWVEEGINLDFEVYDLDNDSFIDYIEWIVPHLSTQTFQIILITEAYHLDSERNVLEEIFSEVSVQDDIWAFIPDGDFVRVSFEENLTNEKDITVYASSDYQNAKIEIYPENSNTKIAEIVDIAEPGFYKTFLTNLIGIEDTFDLRMVGDILIDLIIDPVATGYCTSIISCSDNGAPATCTCSQVDSSDDTYAGGDLRTKSGNLAEVQINMTNTSLLNDYLISDATLYIEMGVDAGLSTCTIDYSIGGGSWNSLDSDCTDEVTQTVLSFDMSSLDEEDLENLYIKISAVKSSPTGAPLSLIVDHVYLNVTYATLSGNLQVWLNSPEDDYESMYNVNQFNYTPISSTGDFTNCTFWDNSSSGFSQKLTNSSAIINGTNNTFSRNISTDGEFLWNVQCCDATNGCFFGPLNRTIFIDTTSPVVTSLSPANDSTSNSLYGVDFVYNVTDARDITQCSLILDGSSVMTDDSITKDINQTLSYPVPSGVHTWAIECLDFAGNKGYTENRTINVSFTDQTYDRRWYETSSGENYTSTANIYLSNTRDSEENMVSYTIPAFTEYNLVESVSPFMGNNGALIGSGTVSFSGYFTASANNKEYITWKVYVSNSSGDFLICQDGDDSTSGTRITSATGTYTGSCTNPSDVYLSSTDRIKLVINIWNGASSNVAVGHYWDNLYLSYVEFNTFSSLGDLSTDLTYPLVDLNITTDDSFNATCFVNCSAGDCLSTNVYLQYNTSATGWTNIGSSGNLILAGGETNPHNLGTINTTGGYTNFTIDANLASVNNIRCVADSTYSSANGPTTREVSVSGVNQPPFVSLFYPGQNSWVNSSSFDFTYYVDDVDDDAAYCDLYIDGIYNQTNSTPLVEGVYNNFSITGLSQGLHNWSVNCTDAVSQSNSSGTWDFYVDSVFPQIDLIYPGIDETIGTNDINFNFTVSDNLDDPLVCNLTIDGIVEDEGFSASNGTYTNRTILDLSVGDHLWNVSCIDEAGNVNTSETRNFTIGDSNPIVHLVYPENDSWLNTTNPTLIYNVTENNQLAYCDLYIDGIYNQSNSTILNNTGENNFTILGLSQGIHNWTVNCTDDASLSGISETWDFYVDSIFPQINLNSPVHYFNSSEGDTNFNFTVIDNLGDPLTCNLTIDSIVVDPSFSASNGSFTTRLINNVDDGLHYWNVSCMDEAGNVNTSETRILNVTEYPSVTLQTEDDSAFNYTPIDLDYLPNDNGGFQTCDLYLNGVYNQSNSTPISKGLTNTFTVSAGPGYYNWSVECTDSFGLVNMSENRTFSVDLAAPNVTSYFPIDGDVIYSSVVDFNFTVTDDLETNLSCSLIVDGNVTNSSYFSNNSVGNFSETFSTGGVKFWNISCTDSAGNIGYTETRNFTLYTPPVIALVSPGNLSWTKDNPVVFIYNISDGNDDLKNATLILDGMENQTNSTVLVNWGQNNFTVSGLSEGTHNWTVMVYDNENLLGTQPAVQFTVDRTSPVVTLNYPQQDNISDDNNVTLNFSISDNLDTNFICSINVDGFYEFDGETFYSGDNLRSFVRGDGNYSWFVECVDTAQNYFMTSTVNFSIVAPPKVTLNFPTSNYYMNSSSIVFNYTPEDAIGITSCTLYVDGVQNETDNSIERYEPNYFSYSGISEGVHNWTVECLDSDSNTYSPPVENFIRDITPPTIILVDPLNGSTMDASGNVAFRWRAIDVFDGYFYCDLYVDGALEAGNQFVENYTLNTEIVSGLSIGEHTWNVTCWDGVYNYNTSANWTFNYTYSDLFINSSEIYLNVTNPRENEPVNVSATIRNIGYADVTNALVQFYLGDPFSGGIQIGTDQNIDINGSSFVNVSQEYLFDVGLNEVYVIVDQYDAKTEFNETNNLGGKNITVGAWQFFYGDLLSEANYTLDNSVDSSIVDWSINDFDGGSIFVADSDSSISWADVLALGKTTLGGDSSSDLSEADGLLFMTGFEDSITNLYIGAEDSFSVFDRIVDSVPVTNSTNNTNFITGILWDSSDNVGDNEYDSADAEDLIFVTKIESNLQGAYGSYDYEMRVPANLRNYSGGTSNTVSFYMEVY